jgi:hypothetical protein
MAMNFDRSTGDDRWLTVSAVLKFRCFPMRVNRFLFFWILIAGMFLPSSVGGNVSKLLFATGFSISAALIAFLSLRVGIHSDLLLCITTAIPVWLISCTLLSMYYVPETNLATLAVFILLGFIYCIKVRKLECSNLEPLLAAVSIINIGLGVTMLFVTSISALMVAHYNNFYEELVPAMIGAYKPVTFFATHSLAGTFDYLLFFLCFRTYEKTYSHNLSILRCSCFWRACVNFQKIGDHSCRRCLSSHPEPNSGCPG